MMSRALFTYVSEKAICWLGRRPKQLIEAHRRTAAKAEFLYGTESTRRYEAGIPISLFPRLRPVLLPPPFRGDLPNDLKGAHTINQDVGFSLALAEVVCTRGMIRTNLVVRSWKAFGLKMSPVAKAKDPDIPTMFSSVGAVAPRRCLVTVGTGQSNRVKG